MLKTRQSKNGWLWYLENEDNEIVRIAWSKEKLLPYLNI